MCVPFVLKAPGDPQIRIPKTCVLGCSSASGISPCLRGIASHVERWPRSSNATLRAAGDCARDTIPKTPSTTEMTPSTLVRIGPQRGHETPPGVIISPPMMSQAQARYVFELPKNGKGRSIKLTQAASDALRGHLECQLEEIDGRGDDYQDQGLIFSSRKGTPMNARNLTSRSFKPILKRAGLPNIRLHDLRHTCATLMLWEGVHIKLVQELLGHATISITLDTYSHLLPGMGDEAAGAMDRIFS